MEANNDQKDSMVFQLARFISFYDVYVNLCQSKSNYKYLISRELSKESTLILLLSDLYALFDDQKNAQSLKKISFKNTEVENLRVKITNEWVVIETKIKIIRHNIGFHTSEDIKGIETGVSQFKDLGDEPFKLINDLIELYYLLRIDYYLNY